MKSQEQKPVVKIVKYLDLLSKDYNQELKERRQLLNDKAANQLSADITENEGLLLDKKELLNNALSACPFSATAVVEAQNEVNYMEDFMVKLRALKSMF